MEVKEQNINDELMLDFEANLCFIIGLLPYTQLNDNDPDIVFILTMCDSSFINDEFLLLILSIVKSFFPFVKLVDCFVKNGMEMTLV